LNSIREQVDKHLQGKAIFDPAERTTEKVLQRRFLYKWDQYMEEKEERVRRNERSPSYVRILHSYCRKHYEPLHNMDVREIRLVHLSEINRNMEGSIKTRKNVFDALKSFFVWLKERDGCMEMNPLPKFPLIDGDDAQPTSSIDWQTQQEALARIPQPYRDVIEFSMETGCRIGEVCALKVKDVLPDGTIWIRRTWSDYILRETTKGKRKDILPLSDRAKAIISQNTELALPERWLFTNPRTGGSFYPKKVSAVWKNHGGLAIGLHEATRHSFCSQLVADGVPLPVSKELARHADIKTTMRYVHVSDDMTRGAVNERGRGKVVPLRSLSDLEAKTK
jgi:integrase